MKKGKIRNWFNSIFIYQKRKRTNAKSLEKYFLSFIAFNSFGVVNTNRLPISNFPKNYFILAFFLRGFKKNIRLIGNEGLIRLNTYWMDLFGSCKHFVPFIRVLRPRSHCSMDDTRFLHFANRAVCYLLVKVFGLCAIPAIIDCHANRCID